MSREEIIELLESLRLPEETVEDANSTKTEVWRKTNMFDNDPMIHASQVPFLLYDENCLTVIDRTANAVNAGKVNPFTTNWMEVTLYETEFIRQLLDNISSEFIMDVAEAIDDEDAAHQREDGQITVISSDQYGTGQGNSIHYSYSRDNWSNNGDYVSAKAIAEGILDKRKKAEAFIKKIEQRNKKPTPNENNATEVYPPFDADTEMLLQQIAELKDQVNQLAGEKATIEKNNHDLVAREEHHRNEKDKARAENQELLDKIAELEKKLEGKNDEQEFEPEDIMIAEDRKIDVIKILHAMCKIGLLQKTNGSKITQNAVMKYFGKMLNDDFSEYSSNLSTSKSKTKEPSYMQVFDELRKAAYDYFKKS